MDMDKTPAIRQSPSLSIPKVLKMFIKISDKISKRFTTKVATWLFTLPRKYTRPTRENHMFDTSVKRMVHVPSIKKKIQVYEFGEPSKPKILFIHGWAGRGTQMSAIAEALVDAYQVISFDGPAHGYSTGKRTNYIEFVEVVKVLDKAYHFDHAVCHSMGGSVALYYSKHFRSIPKISVIGSPNHILGIFTSFVTAFELDQEYVARIRNMFNTYLSHELEYLDATSHPERYKGKLQIVHDQDDLDVSVESATEMHQAYPDSELILTKTYGHRRILRNQEVIQKIKEFHVKKQ